MLSTSLGNAFWTKPLWGTTFYILLHFYVQVFLPMSYPPHPPSPPPLNLIYIFLIKTNLGTILTSYTLEKDERKRHKKAKTSENVPGLATSEEPTQEEVVSGVGEVTDEHGRDGVGDLTDEENDAGVRVVEL